MKTGSSEPNRARSLGGLEIFSVPGAVDGFGDADRAARTAPAHPEMPEHIGRGASALGDGRSDHRVGQPITDTDNHSPYRLCRYQPLYATYANIVLPV